MSEISRYSKTKRYTPTDFYYIFTFKVDPKVLSEGYLNSDGYNTSAVYLFSLCAVSKTILSFHQRLQTQQTEVRHILYVNDNLVFQFLSSFDSFDHTGGLAARLQLCSYVLQGFIVAGLNLS